MTRQLFVALLSFVVCSTAGAELYVDIGISGGSWPYAPYVITPTSDKPDWMQNQFETFCVEKKQHFSPGNSYLATIDSDILYVGGSGPGDVLEDDVKKIYAGYLNLELGAFSGNIIQKSIWGAQGYTSYDYSILGLDAINIDGWNNVKVLNLWGGGEEYVGDSQSQLVMTPVPVPSALLLGGLGLAVSGWRLRKRKAA